MSACGAIRRSRTLGRGRGRHGTRSGRLAVNSHYALLEALKEYVEWGAMTSSDRDFFIAKFKAAIALAESEQGE